MSNQVDYYNQFATKHRYEILGSDDPSIWTTDREQNGPIFQEMKKRIQRQKEHIVENDLLALTMQPYDVVWLKAWEK